MMFNFVITLRVSRMPLTIFRSSLFIGLFSFVIVANADSIVHATSKQNTQSSTSAQLNFQNDYICNAKRGEMITSGEFNVSSLGTQRFGFPYPARVADIWIKGDVQVEWKKWNLPTEIELKKYEGVRFELSNQSSVCELGSITMTSEDKPKERFIKAQVCSSEPIKNAKIQITFVANPN